MPQAVANAITIALKTVGVPALAAKVIAYAVVAAGSYAISDALTPDAPGASDGQQSVLQPIPSRRRVYGRMKIGGSWIV